MKPRSYSPGCVVAALGLILSCCLAPYLISSVYSLVGAALGTPGAPTWLWGEWTDRLAGESNLLYMLLTEGPICCVGVIALLIIILGVVLTLGGTGRAPAEEIEEEELSPDEPGNISEEY
jgi:hypothetical protein